LGIGIYITFNRPRDLLLRAQARQRVNPCPKSDSSNDQPKSIHLLAPRACIDDQKTPQTGANEETSWQQIALVSTSGFVK
jgi:hypothetical protein